jgi:hypothetical protein
MRTILLAALLWLCAVAAPAQYTNGSSVLDSSGARSSGRLFAHLSAAGQPGGIAASAGGGYVNQAGFLNTFLLQPALDTDGDGLADELDQDNDNDGLADVLEINGSSFAPVSPTLVNEADTDGDGAMDGGEATAGTDPNDFTAQLEITSITNSAGQRHVAWIARGNHQRTYVLRAAPDALQPYGVVLYSNTVAGGSFPWYVVTNTVADAVDSDLLFYAVEVKR